MKVVISQPMLFPWVGLLEQVRLADVYVHYDDVAFSKGSFSNRVQIKTASGPKWLTVPLAGLHLGQRIMDVAVDEHDDWRARHLAFLAQALRGTPYCADALAVAADAYGELGLGLGALVARSLERCAAYFGLRPRGGWRRSSTLGIAGKGWERVLALVKRLDGDVYVTGHGARHYLDHEAFERAGVGVEYMNYQKRPYPQLHGAFTPYVSALDLIANLGPAGGACICSGTLPWREFLASS